MTPAGDAPYSMGDASYSIAAYRGLLGHIRAEGYVALGFHESPPPSARGLYLRFDVDYSLSLARDLARVNSECGVRGTFFVLLRSHAYNLFSPASLACVEEIGRLNQRVALHVALPAGKPLTGPELAALVEKDFAVVRGEIPWVEPVFSWHNPTGALIERSIDLSVPGMVNCYGRRFFRELPYYGDSNLRYTPGELMRLLTDCRAPAATLLLHPLNWVAGGAGMRDVFAGAWPHLVRDQERELLSNARYREWLPEGMPQAVLDGFSRAWKDATL